MKKHTTQASPLCEHDEAAAYLNVPPDTLRDWRRRALRASRQVGRPSRVRYRRSDLDALIESGYTPATSGPLAQ